MFTVLVVDDSPTIRSTVSALLSDRRYEVIAVSGGREALTHFENGQTKVGLCLVDIHMPEMDGFEFCREVRGRGFDVPIIILTSEHSRALRQTGREAGANGWMTKPLDPVSLYETLNHLSEKR